MYSKGVYLTPDNLSIDFDPEFGFFEFDNDGDPLLFPKLFTISLKLHDVETRANYHQALKVGNVGVMVGPKASANLQNYQTGFSHLFPENLQYFRVRGE